MKCPFTTLPCFQPILVPTFKFFSYETLEKLKMSTRGGATLPIAVRAKLAISSESSSDSASPPSSCSSSALSQCHSPLQKSPPSPSQRPRSPTPHPTATLEACEAEPATASPSGPSTLNRFPFVTTDTKTRPTTPRSPLSPTEVGLEAPSARASASDSQSCKTPRQNFDRERELESAAGTCASAVQMPEAGHGHLVVRGRNTRKVTPVRFAEGGVEV